MGEYQKVVGIITLCVVALLPSKLSAQDDGVLSETLQVGVVDLEPFAMKSVTDAFVFQGPISKYLAKHEFMETDQWTQILKQYLGEGG